MLIFLAGLAALLMLLMMGERAATHVWHGGSQQYFDYCATCDVRYGRPAGVPRPICPQGHGMTAVVAEPHTPRPRSNAAIALCAGFILVVVLLTAAGVVQLP
jgi:hypothetical protein